MKNGTKVMFVKGRNLHRAGRINGYTMHRGRRLYCVKEAFTNTPLFGTRKQLEVL